MTEKKEKPKKSVAPVALGCTKQATGTAPWFVDRSEYNPLGCSFKPLVNGEETFREVYKAIEAAKKSVCIICWGFQPSMHFIRDGKRKYLMIGELLEKKAEKGVVVRVLSWALDVKTSLLGHPMNVTGIQQIGVKESNTPGRYGWMNRWQDRPAYEVDAQYDYDKEWYARYDEKGEYLDRLNKKIRANAGVKTSANLHFTSRGFSTEDRHYLDKKKHADAGLKNTTKALLTAFPSHHQKMVLVDYEDGNLATGFVMGHNMLDDYWDTDRHSYIRYHYTRGRNSKIGPRQDISSRVTGPVVGDLFNNFALAWKKETGESLPRPDFSQYPLRGDSGNCPVQAQILRTQPQYNTEDIKKSYLQAINNASTMIYIENQYFRWPPLADKIKAVAANLAAKGADPRRYDSLYLFVVTNASKEGVESGSVNTYRMLENLGRADTIPKVTRAERLEVLSKQLSQNESRAAGIGAALNSPEIDDPKLRQDWAQQQAALDAERARLKQQKRVLEDPKETIRMKKIPGLKVHVCSLVAPDTPAGTPWMDVYVHAKLMIVNDAFLTLGSANVNTRSMEVDSELNIALANPVITQALRRRLWSLHTGGEGAQDDMPKAFKAWADIIKKNKDRRSTGQAPEAPLVEFYYGSDKRTNTD
ncbi:PLD-like domain-containing protein [Formivibrio citricus]|uniref:PLD-like domain-containing protein n=1 Tax=Formivibrio citricus TaxID=83765 RepID=A0A1I4WRQ6_9NEIS|nr:phospholipase D-like domain-containing protein [Formivibrio citricus]SFN15932.1 PLD-like domain-containing protein [Formivibrio citricus]